MAKGAINGHMYIYIYIYIHTYIHFHQRACTAKLARSWYPLFSPQKGHAAESVGNGMRHFLRDLLRSYFWGAVPVPVQARLARSGLLPCSCRAWTCAGEPCSGPFTDPIPGCCLAAAVFGRDLFTDPIPGCCALQLLCSGCRRTLPGPFRDPIYIPGCCFAATHVQASLAACSCVGIRVAPIPLAPRRPARG